MLQFDEFDRTSAIPVLTETAAWQSWLAKPGAWKYCLIHQCPRTKAFRLQTDSPPCVVTPVFTAGMTGKVQDSGSDWGWLVFARTRPVVVCGAKETQRLPGTSVVRTISVEVEGCLKSPDPGK